MHHGAGIGRLDVADDQELVRELALRVEQREIFLVGLHRQDEALLRHIEEFFLELTHQHMGAFDQGGDFLDQRVVQQHLFCLSVG